MEADKKLFWLLAISGALLLLAGPKIKGLSGIEQRGRTKRKRRGRRLFYLYNDRVIPRAQVSNAKALAADGRGSLYAVWAETADQARQAIQEGRAEKYNLSGFISRIPMMFIVNRVVKSLRE